MSKILRCSDAGVDCSFVARGETEEELFAKALEHGKKVHGMNELTPELKEKMRSIVREEKAA